MISQFAIIQKIKVLVTSQVIRITFGQPSQYCIDQETHSIVEIQQLYKNWQREKEIFHNWYFYFGQKNSQVILIHGYSSQPVLEEQLGLVFIYLFSRLPQIIKNAPPVGPTVDSCSLRNPSVKIQYKIHFTSHFACGPRLLGASAQANLDSIFIHTMGFEFTTFELAVAYCSCGMAHGYIEHQRSKNK